MSYRGNIKTSHLMALALELKSEIVWPLLSQGEGSKLYEPPKGPLVVSVFFLINFIEV